MRFVADGMCVCPSRSDEKIQRLRPRIAGAFGHDIEQLSVGLGMKLIEHHAVNVEAVLGVSLGGEDLVEAVGREINHALGGGEELHPLAQGRTHPDHICRYLEHDGGLLAVSGAAVHLRSFLAVTAAEEQGNGGSQFRFAHLLRNLDVGRVELAIAVLLDDSKKVADNPLLPVDKLEWLTRPCALGVTQALDEANGVICRLHIVAGSFRHESCRLVIGQLSHEITSNTKGSHQA